MGIGILAFAIDSSVYNFLSVARNFAANEMVASSGARFPPPRQRSPKKSPCRRIAKTAHLPRLDVTVIHVAILDVEHRIQRMAWDKDDLFYLGTPFRY